MKGARERKIGIAGVVLTMVIGLAPPRPASAQPTPSDSRGGTLWVSGRDGVVLPAPTLDTEVDLRITGMVARARVVQRFANPGDAWLEGVYVFPLPDMAAVDHLDMQIGQRRVEGRIQEKEQAKRTYARAKASGRKASLVSQDRPNLFTTRVANIGPGEEIEIALEYQETLRFEEEGFALRLPLVAAPRYDPPLGPVAVAGVGGFVPAAFPSPVWPVAPPSEGLVNPVRIRVRLEAGFPLEKLVSPTHVIFAQDLAAGSHEIYLEDFADRDFVLEWKPEPGRAPRAALFSESHEDGADVLLMVMPPSDEMAPQHLSREVVFVIDVSGSMGGTSIREARRALLLALERLSPGDRFNVIRFSDRTRALFPKSVRAGSAEVERARRWVRGLSAGGGTDMLPALQVALGADDGAADVRQVVFITDGSIGNEQALFSAIHAGLGRSRLFTVGIGSAPNGYFLKRAAGFGRGTHTVIATPAEVQTKMDGLFRKLESPVLSDVEILWNDAVEMWPERVPDLYAGEPVVVAARVPRFVGEVVVRGRRGGEAWVTRMPLVPGEPGRGIGALWARRKIAGLLEGLSTGADPQLVRQAVVAVALEHHLVSRYTSLVAVDVTPTRSADALLARADIPANLPAGWTAGGTLPRTATPAPLLRLLGALLLAGAGALAWRRG